MVSRPFLTPIFQLYGRNSTPYKMGEKKEYFSNISPQGLMNEISLFAEVCFLSLKSILISPIYLSVLLKSIIDKLIDVPQWWSVHIAYRPKYQFDIRLTYRYPLGLNINITDIEMCMRGSKKNQIKKI